jgi:hypothetical protein
MSRLSRPRLLAVLAALSLLAACGSSDEETTTTTTTEQVSTTEADDNADDSGEGDDGEGDAQSAEGLLEAVERTRASETASVELQLGFDGGARLGSQEATLAGDVALDGSIGRIGVAIDGEADSLVVVLLEERAWIGGEGADVRSAMPDGVDWVEVPSADLLESPAFSNPGDLAFLYLVGGARDVEADGDVYTFTVDFEAAVDSAPEELREEVASTLSFTGSLEPEITGEAELDDEGRLVSLSVVGIQRPSEEEADQLGIDEDGLRIELHARITDIDEAIDVEEPEGEKAPLEEAPGIAQLLGLTPR